MAKVAVRLERTSDPLFGSLVSSENTRAIQLWNLKVIIELNHRRRPVKIRRRHLPIAASFHPEKARY